ncbi:unnamed protein product [Urochloa decumbens]|uniref:VQ domain-containing protein n=1 Tax=Urochloa decumbens TaxID=240449 RepID=A0ABC9CR38_9POAL
MPSHQSPPLMQQQRHQQGLLGPRPATLKVSSTTTNNKEKRPVIIYVESPKVVHAHPSEFKSVVQRLTGAPPPPPPSALLLPPAAPLPFPFQLPLVATEQAPLPAADHAAAAGSVVRSHGLFFSDDQLISPAPAAFLYDHRHHNQIQSTANLASSLGACYHHGDLFVNLHY